MKIKKRTNNNDCGWRRTTPFTHALELLAVVSSRVYTGSLLAETWKVMCRGKGNTRDYDAHENCYLGPPERRRELTRGSLLSNSGDVMNRFAKADGTGEADLFLTHTSSGSQKSCRCLVDNVSRIGDRYGEKV